MLRRWVLPLALGTFVLQGTADARRPGLQVGDMWYNAAGDGDEVWWPGGEEESNTNPDITHHIGFSSFSFTTLITNFKVPSYFATDPNAAGSTIAKFVNDGQDDLADISASFFLGAPDIPGPKYFRVTPPKVTQDGKSLVPPWWQLQAAFNVQDKVMPELGSDAATDDQLTNSAGILTRVQSYAWSTEGYDDLIFEVRSISYPSTPLVPDLRVGERGSAPSPETAQLNPVHRNLYLGTVWHQQSTQRGPSGGAHITVAPDDESRWVTAGLGAVGLWDEINYYDDAALGGSARLFYARDGDASDAAGYRTDGDDRGEPAPPAGQALDRVREALIDEGEFLESYYKGRVVLFLSKNPVTDPVSLSAFDDSNNWLLDNSDPESQQPYLHSRSLDAEWISTANSGLDVVYDWYLPQGTTRSQRIEPSDVEKPGFTKTGQRFYDWRAVWGPWDLALGQSIHMVTAIFVNGPSVSENKRVGLQWSKGQISFAEKEAFLDSGFDSMMVSVNAARQVWADRKAIPGWGVVPVGPVAPAYPSEFNVSSGPDRNELSWTASSGAAHYRIYRTAGFETRPETLLADRVTGTSYTDNAVVRGTRYFYAVTAVSNDGRESSRFATRTFATGVSPFRAPAQQISDVRVVPNPYQIQGGEVNASNPSAGGFNFPGQPNKLLFVNLPAQAIIRIFTITGDLVQELRHTSGSGDESWNLMINDSNQFLTSGIYLAHIASLDPAVPGTHVEKFIVVR